MSTAWARHGQKHPHASAGHSGLISDRLAPPAGYTLPPKKGKGRDSPNNESHAKSKAVQRLENLSAAVVSANYQPKYPKEGCFCRARRHRLSGYIPLCTHCGLVLCELQHPALPCPSCRSSLFLLPSSRQTLLAKINAELERVLQAEADAREREREEQLQRAIEAAGGGAFPVLNALPSNSNLNIHTPQPIIPAQPRKVLSLNSKTKKATLSTISRAPTPQPTAAGPSAAELAAEEAELEDVVDTEERKTRVPPPKTIPEHATSKGTNERRWENLRGGGAIYVQPPKAVRGTDATGGEASGSRTRRRKDKANANAKAAAANVPGAAPKV